MVRAGQGRCEGGIEAVLRERRCWGAVRDGVGAGPMPREGGRWGRSLGGAGGRRGAEGGVGKVLRGGSEAVLSARPERC